MPVVSLRVESSLETGTTLETITSASGSTQLRTICSSKANTARSGSHWIKTLLKIFQHFHRIGHCRRLCRLSRQSFRLYRQVFQLCRQNFRLFRLLHRLRSLQRHFRNGPRTYNISWMIKRLRTWKDLVTCRLTFLESMEWGSRSKRGQICSHTVLLFIGLERLWLK